MDMQQDTYLGGCRLGLARGFACFSHKGWKGGKLHENSGSLYPLYPTVATMTLFRDMKSSFFSLVSALEGQRQHFQGWHLWWQSVCKQGWIISLRTSSDLLQHIQKEKMLCLWPWQSFSISHVHQSDTQTHKVLVHTSLAVAITGALTTNQIQIPVPNCLHIKS